MARKISGFGFIIVYFRSDWKGWFFNIPMIGKLCDTFGPLRKKLDLLCRLAYCVLLNRETNIMFKFLSSLFVRKDNDIPVTLESLQGKWRMVSVGRNGNFAPKHTFAVSRFYLIIQGNDFTIEANGSQNDRGKIRLDTSKSPIHFDQISTNESGQVETHLGIARFKEEGLLENCQGEAGKPRPKNFATQRNDGASLACFRKQSSG